MIFTQIPNELKYPPAIRSKLSTIHSDIISWAVDNFQGTYKERRAIIQIMNSISYICLSGDSVPDNWNSSDPLVNSPVVDDYICRNYLGDVYILEKNVVWDIEKTNLSPSKTESFNTKHPIKLAELSDDVLPTPKEDLFIQSPKIPRFDKHKVWLSGYIGDELFEIYESLPLIPTKQNEIAVTTDVNRFTKSDLLKLYPNCFIQTRAACMYRPVEHITLHPQFGLLIPIDGFSEDQVLNNIIEYPHLYKLYRLIDDNLVSFYSSIEIDGILYNVSDIWEELPESSVIPYSPDFIKEYVTRRYLLERDVKHMNHKYPIFGDLSSFLTLFMPKEDYESLGYDVEELAKQCIMSRVKYKRSRNPVIRRLNNA